MRSITAVAFAAALAGTAACDDAPPSSTSPTGTATVRFAYRASTAPRHDLTAAQRACADAVGRTHIHPSWRSFERIDMTARGADLWEIAFTDVPTTARQSIRISDGNACDENATGAATRNVFANDVLLTEIVPTPGSGIEPGLAFSVAPNGTVTR